MGNIQPNYFSKELAILEDAIDMFCEQVGSSSSISPQKKPVWKTIHRLDTGKIDY